MPVVSDTVPSTEWTLSESATEECVQWDGIGTLCREVHAAHSVNDYKDKFGWIDFVRPVTDLRLLNRLRDEVCSLVRSDDVGDLGIAPPQVVDWEAVDSFWLPHDPHQQRRADFNLEHYRSIVRLNEGFDSLDLALLQRHKVKPRDGNLQKRHEWTIWNCLFGEVRLDGQVYVLDNGDFFSIDEGYLYRLDASIDDISLSDIDFPRADAKMCEEDYNKLVANTLPDFVRMDRQNVVLQQRTTPVELCDLLSKRGHLIHVKRHFGSSDLSHLFAQGATSAELIEDADPTFRTAAQIQIDRRAGNNEFNFFGETPIDPTSFEVVFAVVGDWAGRTLAQALPFFSKINLRRTYIDLARLRFKVSFARIQTYV